MKLNNTDEQVIKVLKENKQLTLAEIAEKTGVPEKKVFKTLRKLFENEMINSQARKYQLLKEKPPVGKDNDEGAKLEK